MPNEFPAGVRVLAVDDDFVVLRTMKRLLIKCGYKVTVAHHALEALQLLRANKAAYDLMISDVNMPDMDGFELLDIVGLEMDLPVIKCHEGYKARSSRLSCKKPVRLEELQLIWKHLAKRSFDETKDCGNKLKNLRHIDVCKTHHANRCKELKDDKIEEDSEESEGEMHSHKKPRVNWTAELHAKFINAVDRLGVDRAVPKKILDIMNVLGLTRENIASHLQKYRKGLKKNAEASASNASSFLVNRTGVNVYKNVSFHPSCFPIHQPYGSHAPLSSTWLPRPLNHQINLCRQNATSSQASRSSTQRQGFITNSEPNKFNCHDWRACDDTWTNDGDSGSNSTTQLGFALDHEANDIFSSNYLFDDNFTNDFDLILEGDKNQLSSCLVLDVDSGAYANQESSTSYFTINLAESFSTDRIFDFNMGEDVDDLHAALKQISAATLTAEFNSVTVAHHALEALQLLRANKAAYDLMISDVNMPDMDGFELLDIVGLEMDFPVIMLFVDCDMKSVMKGIKHGAIDYLVKQVWLEKLQLIWKYLA
ncbi:hypothetical protein HPP92_015846 [Vanilla planifolia]|uniref:Two-component response regulator n=1 Tax=Vanilla planifolia TaxID=51239 RepID=A0A835QJY6_VANPL|nr:hypothetical protein HPP92_015846 [Vanilla planifolia]